MKNIFSLKKLMLLKKILSKLYSNQLMLDKLENKFGCKLDEKCSLRINDLDSIFIGSGSYIGAYSIIDISNEENSEFISTLRIGKNTYIGELNNIRASGGKITIGDDCLISQNVSIIGTNHSYSTNIPIRLQPWSTQNNFVDIENDVWVGCGTIILPGVKIGRGCVIAAGSVVTKSFPEYSVIAGIPASIIKTRK